MKSSPQVTVRAAMPGEGAQVAALWRELWDAHEAWGGYAGSHDPHVYEALAFRLEEDARVRGGQPILGRHIHIVAQVDGVLAGQVEGWFERHGIEESTPFTCEVRSLIVSQRTRACGVGRALLDELARIASALARGTPAVLAAEVLEPNPAHAFYAKVGYVPVSWSTRMSTSANVAAEPTARGLVARAAGPGDALPIALLEATLAERRRAAGDVRFDRPRAVDATLVGSIAAHLGRPPSAYEPADLVVVDTRNIVRAAASLAVSPLDPPFLPARRALLGRFSVDPALDPQPFIFPLLRLSVRLALLRGAATVELTDLGPPGTPLYEGSIAAGATPWSRLVERMAYAR